VLLAIMEEYEPNLVVAILREASPHFPSNFLLLPQAVT